MESVISAKDGRGVCDESNQFTPLLHMRVEAAGILPTQVSDPQQQQPIHYTSEGGLSDVWDAIYEHSHTVEFHSLNASRPGKKLLVLDLDHTVLDFESSPDCGIPYENMRRPYLHEFLSAVYKEYDICIWSQTRWQWVEVKLAQMGMLNHAEYRICFCLDKGSMFKTALLGSIKPLAIIWNKTGWSPKNTLHVDDLVRHFDLNKANGVLVNAFYRIGNEQKRGHKEAREVFKQQERERELYGHAVSVASVARDISSAEVVSVDSRLALANPDPYLTTTTTVVSSIFNDTTVASCISSQSLQPSQPSPPTLPSPNREDAAGENPSPFIEAEPDEELLLLSLYLTCDQLVRSDDVTNCGLDHGTWREYVKTNLLEKACEKANKSGKRVLTHFEET